MDVELGGNCPLSITSISMCVYCFHVHILGRPSCVTDCIASQVANPYVSSRGRGSAKLCDNFAVSITSIIKMLITILLMIEDRCNTSFAKMLAMYIISYIIGDVNGCKTNSVFYFN